MKIIFFIICLFFFQTVKYGIVSHLNNVQKNVRHALMKNHIHVFNFTLLHILQFFACILDIFS